MGVNKGAETLYHLTNLTRIDVAAIARGMLEKMRRDAVDPALLMEMPTIDCDRTTYATS